MFALVAPARQMRRNSPGLVTHRWFMLELMVQSGDRRLPQHPPPDKQPLQCQRGKSSGVYRGLKETDLNLVHEWLDTNLGRDVFLRGWESSSEFCMSSFPIGY